jgi:hypothetical protein
VWIASGFKAPEYRGERVVYSFASKAARTKWVNAFPFGRQVVPENTITASERADLVPYPKKQGRAKNPRRRANHHLEGAKVLSRRVESLAYTHAADGKPYIHKFSPGVTAMLLKDGRVELTRSDGKPLWADF